LNGKPFSFKGHDYQQFITKLIEDNPGHTFVIRKNSQLGLSELMNRLVLARMALRPGEGVLISFPSKVFSQEVIKTRIADVISESPTLRALSDPNVDSASTKRFHNGSILYGVGGSKQSNSSLLNRPISLIFVDELDRQDKDVFSAFASRTVHTAPEDRLILYVSTPTAPGVGIDEEFSECATQYFSITTCLHCKHSWEPDYYSDVKIPGHSESLQLLTKLKASKLPLHAAYLNCPSCNTHLNQNNSVTSYDKRMNEDGVKKKIGVSITPFSAPSFISMPDLVESSLTYSSHTEFLNQGLGKVANLRDSSILPTDIHFDNSPSSGARIFGLDMGKVCYFLSGVLRSDTTIHVDTVEKVQLSDLETFINTFFLSRPTVAGVMDSMPYADLVYRLVRNNPRLYSAIYLDQATPMPQLFKLSMTDKYDEVVRQMAINKNKMMDLLASSISDFITLTPTQHNEELITHVTSMRKVRDYRFEEMQYKWIKPANGDDHFFHALTYLYSASKLAMADLPTSGCVPPVKVFKFKHFP
jgi:hypothetical protein